MTASLRRAAPWALALLVLALVARQAQRIDWPSVADALARQPPAGIALALLLAAASHALVASYDLVGRHLTRHPVGAACSWRIAAMAYAFNLNFGSLVGALALKLRLYLRQGLSLATAGRVIGTSMLTNWLGYLLLGGGLLLAAPPPLPVAFAPPAPALRLLGIAVVALGAGYVVVCATMAGRRVEWRGRGFAVPPPGVALWQAAASVLNWSLMGAIVWLLLGGALPYPQVLGVLLLGAVAGVLTHVPAGLGVLEAVFVACLSPPLPAATLVAALLAYRAVYYLVPLALAVPAYALAESRFRRRRP